jgi:hypothetical protein
MNFIKLNFIKILKKLKLTNYFNFQVYKNINGIKVKIPIINGIGVSNLVIKTNWLDSIINQLIKVNDSVFVELE